MGTDLKTDIFGTITRVGDTVVRDTGAARPWARWLARISCAANIVHSRASRSGGASKAFRDALDFGHGRLTRRWIDGSPMQLAKPCDPAYFRDAARLLRRLHAANVIHNDLAKETNWLVTPDGRPALVDFQLAMTLTQSRTAGTRTRSRRHPPPAQTQAHAICPSTSPRARSAFSPRRRWSRASGWRAASRSIYLSRGRYSAGAIAKARAIGASSA